jgi:phage tail sheath protein FI
MPEYLAPGVYVEEVSYRAKSIEGVSTSTAGFVGTTASGPTLEPCLVQSFTEFEETFGGGCYLGHAARAFFAQGGHRLFVQRITCPDDYARGLQALESVREIAIVAAPGVEAAEELVEHATRCNRFAVLDAGKGRTVEDVLALRERIDSPYAAQYYPWLRMRGDVDVPPSGFIAGMYARVDVERGVWKAPAGEPIRDATGLETTLTQAQMEQLVSHGINPFRVLPDGQIAAWAARTGSSDPEWKYVNVRRYLTYLEHSIDRGTQWTVFEPNSEPLWGAMRETIWNFLHGHFRAGALAGRKPEEAFFVKCDRSTMTQDDLDHGLLVCLVGVAPVRPAEFIVIRIGRWTADHRP